MKRKHKKTLGQLTDAELRFATKILSMMVLVFTAINLWLISFLFSRFENKVSGVLAIAGALAVALAIAIGIGKLFNRAVGKIASQTDDTEEGRKAQAFLEILNNPKYRRLLLSMKAMFVCMPAFMALIFALLISEFTKSGTNFF